MEKRIQIYDIDAPAYNGMIELENYLELSALTTRHKQLIKIKASKINKCPFCIDMHTKEALANGMSVETIVLLDAWEAVDLFSDEEKIILKMTEQITIISDKGLDSDVYNEAIITFGDKYCAQIIMSIVTINAWNRIAISTLKPLDD